jgi:hypothetical protein
MPDSTRDNNDIEYDDFRYRPRQNDRRTSRPAREPPAPDAAQPLTIPGEPKKLWSTAQYLEADELIRRLILEMMEEFQQESAPKPDASIMEITTYNLVQTLLKQALQHSSPSVRMNMACFAWGMHMGDDKDRPISGIDTARIPRLI